MTKTIKFTFPQEVHKGGKGSGNFGHSGRPGKVGGSASATVLSYVDTLDDDALETISRYTDDGYVRINQTLRNMDDPDDDIPNIHIAKQVGILDDVIDGAPPIEHDVLYRMMRGSVDDLGIDLWDMSDYSFASTTYSRKSLDDIMSKMDDPPDSYTIWHISTKHVAGVNGIGAYIENASTQPDEREVLLRRNLTFSVTDMQQDGSNWTVYADLME